MRWAVLSEPFASAIEHERIEQLSNTSNPSSVALNYLWNLIEPMFLTCSLFSMQSSSSVRAGLTFLTGSASIGVDVDALNVKNTGKTKFSRNSVQLDIGTRGIPLPIKMVVKPIYMALKPQYWSKKEYLSLQIERKQQNLRKACPDYAKQIGRLLTGQITM